MFKKLLNLSACIATVFAQEEAAAEPEEVATEPEIKQIEGTPLALATATDGDFVSSGFTGETYWEQGDTKALVHYFSWTTSAVTEGSFIPNYSWIQSYAQMEDTANPGLYLQVTCNVGYTPSQ